MHHELGIQKCHFGCDASDEWSHYLHCAPLWASVFLGCAKKYIANPLERLAILVYTKEGAWFTFLAYMLYHRVNGQLRTVGTCTVDWISLVAAIAKANECCMS